MFSVEPKIEPFVFNQNGIVNEGDSLKIFCTVIRGDMPLNIYWMKDNKTLTDSRFIQKFDDTSLLLRLTYLTLNDAGTYTCVASNPAGVDRYSSSLNVKGLT